MHYLVNMINMNTMKLNVFVCSLKKQNPILSYRLNIMAINMNDIHITVYFLGDLVVNIQGPHGCSRGSVPGNIFFLKIDLCLNLVQRKLEI